MESRFILWLLANAGGTLVWVRRSVGGGVVMAVLDRITGRVGLCSPCPVSEMESHDL